MRQPYPIPRRRIPILFVAFVVFCVAIGYRVVSFQVVRSQDLSQLAVDYRYREDVVPARRGDILDARGRPLATNVPADKVSAITKEVKDPKRTAELLAPIIGVSAQDIEARITDPKLEWVDLARHLTPEASQKITALDLPGIVLTPESRRVYPMGDFASQVLGFVNDEYVGSYGVEGAYDKVLGGTPGKLIGERDEAGNVIALAKSAWDPPVDGADLVLSIDSAVQRIVEQTLDQTIKEQHATGGTIIVQNPKTGEILAMASRPSFDPNGFAQVTDASRFVNPAVSLTYEPGSTFKTLVMALGLETGAVTPNTQHDGGPYKDIPGGRVYNANYVDWGVETMTEVLEHSSNLGAIFVAEQMGQDQFYRGLVSFGIGQPTGVDLQGEASGIFPLPGDKGWNAANFYTNAFGQGLAVTPLQLVNAVSALANGGSLMRPHVVKEIRGRDGTKEIAPQVVRRVISPETSKTITSMLTTVVDAKYRTIRIPGYEIAAKTGTAQVPSPSGGYDPDA
ncbi:MAG: penicillin-binding protein 2, partial [Thermomicrobiaceae bacterium]|nr:penicillin-binding protein 2 [Thermomicrobiaceae bacterium]